MFATRYAELFCERLCRLSTCGPEPCTEGTVAVRSSALRFNWGSSVIILLSSTSLVVASSEEIRVWPPVTVTLTSTAPRLREQVLSEMVAGAQHQP